MEIKQRFIPANLKNTRPGTRMTPRYLTIHETDNPSVGATALAHAKLQERGNSRQASWHLTVDDKECYQSIPFNEIAWAAGDGGKGTGNTQSIHLEICVNADGDYKKAVQNAVEVSKHVIETFNIPISNVVQHNRWSGKNCPSIMRSGRTGITWNSFIDMLSGAKSNPTPIVSQPTNPQPTSSLLKKENKGEQVKQLQQKLVSLGYSLPKYGCDGDFGQETLDQVLAFQRDHGLVVDGIVGQNTWSALNSANPKQVVQPTPKPVVESLPLLRKGDKGQAVKDMQSLLNNYGYGLVIDGDFGNNSDAALRDFQKNNGLTVDGLCGNQSWSKLKSGNAVHKQVAQPVQTAPQYPNVLIKEGSRGDYVKMVQRIVGANPDGIFGAKTKAAVKAYQSRNGLVADGIVGAKTWAVMF